jgi:hypothetical protein
MTDAFRSLLGRFPLLQTVLTNPVVVRDLRSQMRGTRSYWYQGAYLLLLGVLALAGYAQATGQGLTDAPDASYHAVSVVDAQGRLQQLYYFIFLTLAALISLIAPALTAASVVGERQRLSLDLLVTTPLTAAELLIGKLVSSVAFLGLLLALSLPASALCVLLGGATLGDVFRVYALLAVDGVVLAGIGLFFSCAARTNLLAVVWSYAATVGFLFGTGALFALSCPDDPVKLGSPTPLLALAALNPFAAVCPPMQQSFVVGPVAVPVWLGAFVAAALAVRLLVTAATFRLGLHGGAAGPSLRRQVLLASGLGAFLTAHGAMSSVVRAVHQYEDSAVNVQGAWYLSFGLIFGFLAAAPFLPGLFVPAPAEDAPPGVVEDAVPEETNDHPYRFRVAFRPWHPGALPFFHLWLLTTVGAVTAGIWAGYKASPGGGMVTAVLCSTFYLSGLGFLVWAISRWAAVTTRGVSGARALAFGTFAILSGVPMLVLSLGGGQWEDNQMSALWLFRPLLTSHDYEIFPAQIISGVVGYSLGVGFVLLRRVMVCRRATAAVAAS